MKYYCKNCRTEIKLGDGVRFTEHLMTEIECPFCFIRDIKLLPISDYETPQQYEKRTGKAYPDEAVVWVLVPEGRYNFKEWMPHSYKNARNVSNMISVTYPLPIVIADPPVPPPDDWKPEEE